MPISKAHTLLHVQPVLHIKLQLSLALNPASKLFNGNYFLKIFQVSLFLLKR